MKVIHAMHKKLISALAVAMLGMVTVAVASSSPAEQTPAAKAPAAKVNHYIGVGKCKSCHNTAVNGNAFECWTKSKHSEAFKTLAGDAAKKAGATKGVTDPQKDDKCVKCHVTGFGLPEDQFKKGFDRTAGVQCETCHGPGETHMSARMAAAQEESADAKGPTKIPEGEIQLNANPKFCQGCHNPESPSYKPFCFHERMEKIAHYDPRGTRKPPTPLKECPCDATCECKKGPCKDLPQKK
jgi:hypothetical protein